MVRLGRGGRRAAGRGSRIRVEITETMLKTFVSESLLALAGLTLYDLVMKFLTG